MHMISQKPQTSNLQVLDKKEEENNHQLPLVKYITDPKNDR